MLQIPTRGTTNYFPEMNVQQLMNCKCSFYSAQLNTPWKPSKAEAIFLCEYKPSTFLSDGSSFLFWYCVFVWSVWKWKAFRQQKVTAWKFHCFAVLKPCYFVGFSSGKSNMVFYITNRIAKRKSTSLPFLIVSIVLRFTGINIHQQSEKTSEVL